MDHFPHLKSIVTNGVPGDISWIRLTWSLFTLSLRCCLVCLAGHGNTGL